MKFILLALLLPGTLAVAADQVVLSGDIRLRGYYLDNTDDLDRDAGKPKHFDTTFLTQRTRVLVEADLAPRVRVAARLTAEGGAGVDQDWDAGFSDAYIQFNDLFDRPAQLTLGRQRLHYGRGLILSSVDDEYNFDAAKLVLDFAPVTVDIVAALPVERQGFSATPGKTDTHLLFLNARYARASGWLRNVEAYLGYLNNTGPAVIRVPPTDPFFTGTTGASPYIVGIRGDIAPTTNFEAWGEAAYEWGRDGDVPNGNNINAALANLGFRYTWHRLAWSPALHASYTVATGGSGGVGAGGGRFRPWFDYVEGQNGYIFNPLLSNIRIINIGLTLQPQSATTVALQGYYYRRSDHSVLLSNPNLDYGGFRIPSALASNEDGGMELDAVLRRQWARGFRTELIAGVFLPGKAFTEGPADGAAFGMRGELVVSF